MLRMMMRANGGSDPDAAFKAMMQEFATEWAGRAPSTDDFRVIAERHQTAEMDLSGDGTLNYFFDQWVYGTDIPRFESTLEVDDIGEHTYRISGSVTQSDVPDGFLSPPLFARARFSSLCRADNKIRDSSV